MDCPPGDNKVAIVVERWPLQEVWLYFSKYCVVVLFSCLRNSFPSIRTGRLSWSSRRDFSKQRLNKFSYMLMLIKHPYKFDMLGIPVYALPLLGTLCKNPVWMQPLILHSNCVRYHLYCSKWLSFFKQDIIAISCSWCKAAVSDFVIKLKGWFFIVFIPKKLT